MSKRNVFGLLEDMNYIYLLTPIPVLVLMKQHTIAMYYFLFVGGLLIPALELGLLHKTITFINKRKKGANT